MIVKVNAIYAIAQRSLKKKFRTSTTSPLYSKTNHKSSKNHPECYICYSKFRIAWEFEISLVVFIPNIITNHAITYTNSRRFLQPGQEPHCTRQLHITCIKTESNRKLSNFNFHWTKTLYQNNLNNIAFFFTFFKGYRCNQLSVITPKKISNESPRK